MSPNKSGHGSAFSKTKLRASCDGCYLSKIKCNKARPMCSRCLTYGIDCVYSPSSRSGRAKKEPENDKSRDGYDSGHPAQMQDKMYDNTHQISRSPVLYIPPVAFSDVESSSHDTSTTVLTSDLGQCSDQNPLDERDSVRKETDFLQAGSAMEPFNASFWFPNAEPPTIKGAYTFPENDQLPLTSELLFSSPNMSWDQFSDGQLDFTSYNTPTLPFTTSHSPNTSSNAFIPPTCTLAVDCHQDPRVFHNHSSLGLRQPL
jgi:hypothetical protein